MEDSGFIFKYYQVGRSLSVYLIQIKLSVFQIFGLLKISFQVVLFLSSVPLVFCNILALEQDKIYLLVCSLWFIY